MIKPLLVCSLLTFYNPFLNAQTLISEDFEDTTVTYVLRSETENSVVSDNLSEISDKDYFGRVQTSDFSGTDVIIDNVQGNFFFAAGDTDGIGTMTNFDSPSINWFDIPITDFTSLNVSAFFAESDGSGESWDSNTSVRIEYSFNNTDWIAIFGIEATGTNTIPMVDTDLDGVGDGTEINATLQKFSTNFSTEGNSSVSIRIIMDNINAGDEDIAIDNFIVENNNVLDVDSVSLNNEFVIYSIPASDILTISNTSTKTIHAVSLIDMQGSIISTNYYKDPNSLIKIDLSTIQNGVYLITISTVDVVITKKIIVSK